MDEERKEDDRGIEVPPTDDNNTDVDDDDDDDDDNRGEGETIKFSTIKKASPLALQLKKNIKMTITILISLIDY